MSSDLFKLLQQQSKSLIELYDAVERFDSASGSLTEACDTLVQLSELKAAVGIIYDVMAKTVTDMFAEEDIVALPSGHAIERRWSKNRKGWRHKEIVPVVVDRVERMSINMDTGEITLTPRQMMERMFDFIQPSYWRVGALQEVGINADDYCEAGDSTPSLSIRKPDVRKRKEQEENE